jgi:hypothetical protein
MWNDCDDLDGGNNLEEDINFDGCVNGGGGNNFD